MKVAVNRERGEAKPVGPAVARGVYVRGASVRSAHRKWPVLCSWAVLQAQARPVSQLQLQLSNRKRPDTRTYANAASLALGLVPAKTLHGHDCKRSSARRLTTVLSRNQKWWDL